jgi:autotransporter-associated beta strand protein
LAAALGVGGDIFVMAGASLTIVGGSLGPGTVAGGAGGGFGVDGQAFGGGLFLQGNETITLAPAAGKVERISGVIADQTGSGGAGANAGAGSLTLNGAGTLDLTAANTFSGGTTIDQGVLELAKASAGGSGGIDFASTSGEIEYSAGANLANAISGFGGADNIDFSKVAFAARDHAVDSSGAVSIETATGKTVARFTVSGTYTSANFHVGADTSGHVLVTDVATGAPAASGPAIASPADLLGVYGADFAEAPWGAGALSAFDSWSALASGAGTDTGGFGFHHENYGNLCGARDAWGVGVGWGDSFGHGPG